MTACPEIDQPLIQKSAKIILIWPRQRNHCYPVAFSLLLLWRVVGALLYMIRDVACFRVQSTAYQCKRNPAFLFSEELTRHSWLLCGFSILSLLLLFGIFPSSLVTKQSYISWCLFLHSWLWFFFSPSSCVDTSTYSFLSSLYHLGS